MNQLRSTDLRLGNLVLFRGKICKVTTLSGDIIRVDEPEVGIIEQAYAKSPIPLTHEILEEAGFTRDGDEFNLWFLQSLRFTFVIDLYKKEMLIRDKKKTDPSARGMASLDLPLLHQLQNLYYSLTGEELTISLPTVKLER